MEEGLVIYNRDGSDLDGIANLIKKKNEKRENTHIFPQDINIIVQHILFGLDDMFKQHHKLPDFIEIRGSRLCHFLADILKDNNFKCPIIPINLVLEDNILLIRRGRNLLGTELEPDTIIKLTVIFNEDNRVTKVEKTVGTETTSTDVFILNKKE